MLKLSKISKVILLSGMILAMGYMFSPVSAFAAETQDNKNTNTVIGGSVTTYTTNGRTTGVKTSGGYGDVDDKGKVTTANNTSAWENAVVAKNSAQDSYTKATTAYNKCLASGGDCSKLKEEMDTAKAGLQKAQDDYNKAQKETSEQYWENKKNSEKAQNALNKAKKKQEKAQKEYNECVAKNGADSEKCKKKQDKLTDANTALTTAEDNAKQYAPATNSTESNEANKTLSEKAGNLQKKIEDAENSYNEKCGEGAEGKNAEECAQAKRELDKLKRDNNAKLSDMANQAEIDYKNKEQAAKEAEKECERYSAMTSKDAQVKAQQACAQAVSLRKEADAAQAEYDKLKGNIVSSGAGAAERRLKKASNAGDAGVLDISQSRQITVGGSGHNSLGGYRSEFFNYGSSSDVLETVTRRAALAVVSLKPIAYIFAGFGLIAFAWMAIFNKLSWKWFANIAMGLFLVANMGRLIEYLVTDDGTGGYYIGVWSDGAKGGADTRLANSFKDTYYVYGDTAYNAKGIRDFQEGALAVGGKTTETFTASAAGFCKGTSGSGWANFTSCLKDIVSTAKKAANTVKTVKAAAEDVVDRVEAVKDTVDNIAQAAKAMKGASLSEIVANAGTILNNVNAAVSTTTGAVGSLTNAASAVSNNIQDMGKSVAQQQELADRRARGEATNAFDAKLKGQEWDAVNKGVENVDGQWAGKETFISKTAEKAADINSKTSEVNNKVQEGLAQVGAVTNVIENTALTDIVPGLSLSKNADKYSETLNQKRQEKKEKAHASATAKAQQEAEETYKRSNAGINANYKQQASQVSQVYSDIQQQKQELQTLENEKMRIQKDVDNYCAKDKNSAMCKAAKGQMNAIESSLDAKNQQLKASEEAYEKAKKSADDAYVAALNSNISKAEEELNIAQKDAEEVCKNGSASDCAKARQRVVNASNTYASYVNEKENKTGASREQTKEDIDNSIVSDKERQEMKRLQEQLEAEKRKQEDLAKNENYYTNQAYGKAVDEANDLYDKMNAQKEEVERLEKEAKEKAKKAAEACSKSSNSSVCTTAQLAADAAKDAAANKKQQAANTQKQYNEAKQKAESSYGTALDSNKNKAQQDYDKAKSQATTAKQQMEETSTKVNDTKQALSSAQDAYNTAVSEADAAKQAYEKAGSEGKTDAEIAKLKAEYEAKLRAMNEANKAKNKKQSEYDKARQQYNDAEKAYNKAYGDANNASQRLASYTNEDVNKTGESRKNTNEDLDNQALINQYKTETNPTAVAQASKNNYIQSKNSTDVAKYNMDEKQAIVNQAKKDYEAAAKKAKETGSEADQKIADRLKKNYNLAQSELERAQKEYKNMSKELSAYEADYARKAIASEEYKQGIYNSQMKQASSDINTYEAALAKQLKIVDNAATAYMQAKNNASDSNKEALQKAAKLYDEYKKAKSIYDEYQTNLSVARNNYTTAKNSYDASVIEVARLKKLLETK
ncbi:MAG: hypothetical protein E7017_03695 [Alphaproteobacteria bacterium]|nr:hypothetical protein [Alphaproteobacteria bacterium]